MELVIQRCIASDLCGNLPTFQPFNVVEDYMCSRKCYSSGHDKCCSADLFVTSVTRRDKRGDQAVEWMLKVKVLEVGS
jgi:hypothetical protein